MPRDARSRSSARSTDAAILAALGVLALLSIFEPHLVAEWMPPCLSKTFLGVECWGCGMTRAVLACLQGDFAAAWQYNPRYVVVVPLIAWSCARLALRVVRPQAQPA